jgi:hypothetical protein
MGNFLPCLCSQRLNSKWAFCSWIRVWILNPLDLQNWIIQREAWVWFIGGVFSESLGAYCVKITIAQLPFRRHLGQSERNIMKHRHFTCFLMFLMFSSGFSWNIFTLSTTLTRWSGLLLRALDLWPPPALQQENTGDATGNIDCYLVFMFVSVSFCMHRWKKMKKI